MTVLDIVLVIVAVVILWRLYSFAVGLSRARKHPELMEHTGPFWEAWERRHGRVVPGRTRTYPPAGLFQQYVAASKQTGISPEDFLRQSGW